MLQNIAFSPKKKNTHFGSIYERSFAADTPKIYSHYKTSHQKGRNNNGNGLHCNRGQ